MSVNQRIEQSRQRRWGKRDARFKELLAKCVPADTLSGAEVSELELLLEELGIDAERFNRILNLRADMFTAEREVAELERQAAMPPVDEAVENYIAKTPRLARRVIEGLRARRPIAGMLVEEADQVADILKGIGAPPNPRDAAMNAARAREKLSRLQGELNRLGGA